MTTIYESVDILKDTFHLNDLRFGITLWMRFSRDEEFIPSNIRCISAISTEVGKVNEYLLKYFNSFSISLLFKIGPTQTTQS